MKKTLVSPLLAFAPAVWAQSPPPDPQGQVAPGHDFTAKRAAKMGQALGLDAAGTQRIQSTLDGFAPKKQALHQQMGAPLKVLRQASQGDAGAVSQVDAAVDQLK